MARLDLLAQSDLPDDYQYLLSEDAMGEINLLCAMAHNPKALQSYMKYGSTLWTNGGLKPADLERCILAIARALNSRYEWHQHVPLAQEQGVDAVEIASIGRDDIDALAERPAALTRYAQAVALGQVDENIFERITTLVDDATVVGITLLAAHYVATARFLDALDVPTEETFIGWEPTV